MTAQELIKLLEGVPGDAPVIGFIGDHTYAPAKIEVVFAVNEGDGTYCLDTDMFPNERHLLAV